MTSEEYLKKLREANEKAQERQKEIIWKFENVQI
jgi:hypothetical protein